MSVRVKAHTRGPADPLTPDIEAKRRRFQSKWGIAMVSANDDRLAAPIPDPVPGPAPMSLAEIAEQLAELSKLAAQIGRQV
ncbi:hypothetical protein [Neorhizobium sp. AL 9.2.2]|uniref:hypothetical protein n=1 Tax=Neorhizobium sp. AL 9.2.2 TaxID=2712894 RepID=UPI0015718FE2|nr:hypothetical protein [Neorhizobium sp. AL 9.2.2]NSY17218.1 hypothetical protein [Neorhizobium sp. AL 9.2.2]